jgi:hypothetical protein
LKQHEKAAGASSPAETKAWAGTGPESAAASGNEPSLALRPAVPAPAVLPSASEEPETACTPRTAGGRVAAPPAKSARTAERSSSATLDGWPRPAHSSVNRFYAGRSTEFTFTE